MGKRRTKQEKIIAKLRKQAMIPNGDKENKQSPSEVRVEKRSFNSPSFYQPELSLPVKLVKLDLTKTVIVTILALILQIALAIYLNNGGWQVVKSFLRI